MIFKVGHESRRFVQEINGEKWATIKFPKAKGVLVVKRAMWIDGDTSKCFVVSTWGNEHYAMESQSNSLGDTVARSAGPFTSILPAMTAYKFMDKSNNG
jgi:hypothetical protein